MLEQCTAVVMVLVNTSKMLHFLIVDLLDQLLHDTDLDTGHVVSTSSDLIDVAHLPHQHLGRVLVVTLGHRDLRVIEDGFVDDAHLVPVQLLHQVVVDHAGVDTRLDLQTTLEGLAPRHRLQRHEEVEVETGHITGHHGQLGQTLAVDIQRLLIEKYTRNLIPDKKELL